MERRPSSGLRRGKWTQEEEAYAERVIRDFNGGLLDAAPGTTLRSYLSDKLNCDPMRITKKFTGDASIGKRVFHPRENASPAAVERSRREIAELEATWRRKLEQQRREAEAADRKRRAADEPLTVSTSSTRRIRAWLAGGALGGGHNPAPSTPCLPDGDRLARRRRRRGRAAGAARRRRRRTEETHASLGREGAAPRRLSRVGAEPPRSNHRRGRRRLGTRRAGRRRRQSARPSSTGPVPGAGPQRHALMAKAYANSEPRA